MLLNNCLTLQVFYSLLAFTGFAFLHSLLARTVVKKKILAIFPSFAAFYRLVYVAIALVTLALWWWYLPSMNEILYAISSPWRWINYGLQGVSLVGFAKALKDGDMRTFLGINQIINYLKEGNLPGYYDEPASEKLKTSGLYHYIRHPLYTFSILFMILQPVMTSKWAFMTVLFVLYFWVGSYFEEKSLVRRFGTAYKKYQQKVPRFIPDIRHIKNP